MCFGWCGLWEFSTAVGVDRILRVPSGKDELSAESCELTADSLRLEGLGWVVWKRHAPGAEAPFFIRCVRPEAEASGYLEADDGGGEGMR